MYYIIAVFCMLLIVECLTVTMNNRFAPGEMLLFSHQSINQADKDNRKSLRRLLAARALPIIRKILTGLEKFPRYPYRPCLRSDPDPAKGKGKRPSALSIFFLE